MQRPVTIRPKNERDGPPSLSSVPEKSRTAKRRCISSACTPCRKRKSKCDGGRPTCSTCTAVYHTTCSYDDDSDHRRKAALKKDIATLQGEKESLVMIIKAIKSSSDTEVTEIVQQIRANENLDTVAETLKNSLSEGSNSHSEGEFSNVIGHPAIDDAGTIKTYGHTSSMGLVSSLKHSSIISPKSEVWTTVTGDLQLVRHLMELYFCWVHPFYSFFSMNIFLDDMTNQRTNYCSSLLINALLAVGCLYSDLDGARLDPTEPRTAGDHFFAEAKRLLSLQDSPCLTTVQALALMGLREASCDRDHTGFQYSGRCIRMMVELGLHLSFGSHGDQFCQRELEARRTTAWACFNYDTTWSICVGRISQLPRAAIDIDKSTIVADYEMQPWRHYTDWEWIPICGSEQATYSQTLLHQISALSEIVNEMVFMFYAPHERLTNVKLWDLYSRSQRWFAHLPAHFQLSGVNTPHVLLLHMYYHIVVLHLFRPCIKFVLQKYNISPREICTSSADKAAELVATYRSIYGLRRCPLLITHVVHTSSIIHLLDLPNPSSAQYLAESIRSLHEISNNHPICLRFLRIIRGFADQEDIQIPPEVEKAMNTPPEAPMNVASEAQAPFSYFTPMSNPTQDYEYINGSGIAGDLSQSSLKSCPPSVGQLYWSPFSDGSVPLQVQPEPESRMDINAMIETPNDQWDAVNQLYRDGFCFAASNTSNYNPGTFYANGHYWPQV